MIAFYIWKKKQKKQKNWKFLESLFTLESHKSLSDTFVPARW